MVARYLNRNK